MNTKLSSAQIESYQRDGFVLHRNFLNQQEVDELKSAVLEAVSSMGRRKVAGRDAEGEAGDGYYDNVFTQRLNLWLINDTVKSYMLDMELGNMLQALEGTSFRVWHDQALIKEPFGNPTSWHLDNPYWSFYSKNAISIWIALEPATLENGCMWFIPGTHRLARFENVGIGQNLGGLFKVYPEMAKTDPVAVPMLPGDCSFHNGLTAHGAGANMTRGRRIAMTCAYMPEGSVFNGQRNILPEPYFKSLAIGDKLENDDWNPRLYS